MNRRLFSSTLSLCALAAMSSFAVQATRARAAAPVVRTRVLTAAAFLQSGDADAEYNAGVQAYSSGNFDQAITHFASATKIRPRFADAWYNLGLCYEAKKDPKQAITSFTKVFETKPKLVDAYIERGKTYAGSGDFDSAMKDFSQALTIKPNYSDAFMARADAYFQKKQYDLAVADYQKYLTLEPKPDPLTYYNLGAVNYAGSHFDAAVEAFNKFATLAKPEELSDTYSFLGDSYSAKKDYPDAVTAYTKYITTHPNDQSGSALKGRALAYLQSKQNAKAITDYSAYLALHPDDKEALNNKIVAMSGGGGSSAELMATLNTAVQKDPTNMTLRATLAAKLIETKDFAGAITQYNAILAAKPGDSAALFNRGVAYGQQKDYPKAAADFGAYTKVKPEDGAGWNNLGIFLGQQKDYKGAITAFTQYITLKPADKDFVDVYKNRGIAYYNVQDNPHALADLKQYDAAKPNDAEVLNLIAQTSTGADAINALLAVTTAKPTDSDAWFNLGVAYLNSKPTADNEKAIAAFTKSNGIKPDAQTLFNRGLAYYNTGAFAKSEADTGAALALKADYPEALLLKADSEYSLKKADVASGDYEKYANLAGVTPENKLYAYKRMLQAYIDNKNFAKVVTVTTSLIAQTPAEPQNYFLRGAAYVAQQNYDSAIPDLVKYTGMKADDSVGFFNLGAAYTGKKDYTNAAAAYQKAAAIKPDYYDAANQAATAYKLMGDADQADATKCAADYDKAVANYDKAAAITSATPKQQADALYNEAAALEAKAKALDSDDPLKAAITVWNKWLTAAPTDPEAAKIKQHVSDLQAKVAKDG